MRDFACLYPSELIGFGEKMFFSDMASLSPPDNFVRLNYTTTGRTVVHYYRKQKALGVNQGPDVSKKKCYLFFFFTTRNPLRGFSTTSRSAGRSQVLSRSSFAK